MLSILFLLCKYYVINIGLSFITYICTEFNISCDGLIPYGRRSSAACLKIIYAKNTCFVLNSLLTAYAYCPSLSWLSNPLCNCSFPCLFRLYRWRRTSVYDIIVWQYDSQGVVRRRTVLWLVERHRTAILLVIPYHVTHSETYINARARHCRQITCQVASRQNLKA